jgi:PAS domain S-box-containing protein
VDEFLPQLVQMMTTPAIDMRKQAERAEAETREQQFRTLANSIPQLAWMADAEGYIFWYNDRWYDYTGTTLEEMEGWGWRKAHHPDEVERVVERIKVAFATGEPWEDTFPLRGKNGEYRWFLSRALPIRDADGQVVRWFGTNTDITEQREMEQALRESEQQFRTLANSIPQLAWMADHEGYIFWYNDRWYEYTGTTLEQMEGWGWQKVHHPDEVARVVERIKIAFSTGEPWDDTFPLRSKAGAYRWFLSRALPIKDAEGKVVRWFGTNTDITVQRQMERALRETRDELERRVAERTTALSEANEILKAEIAERKRIEERLITQTEILQRSEREFSTLVENSPDIIARLDRDLRYIYMSPGLERAMGIPPEQFIGRTSSQVPLKDYDWQSFEECCHEAIRENKTIHRAIEYNDRTYWTRVTPELAADGAVESVMTISQDVTDRVRAEKGLVELTAQLFRIQDEERRRIARELHDGTAQNLFGISTNLAKLNQLSVNNSEAKRLIDECESLGNESLQEIRTLSYLLHPPLLDEAGLVSALQWYVQGFTKRSGIYVDLVTQPMDRLPADVELAFFRIVQESLTNVRRHSGSETACIRLENRSSEILLQIQDRGRGLTAQKMSDDADDIIEMGVGIPGMQQRLHQLGGRLEIDSNSEGTTITAMVPIGNGTAHGVGTSRSSS